MTTHDSHAEPPQKKDVSATPHPNPDQPTPPQPLPVAVPLTPPGTPHPPSIARPGTRRSSQVPGRTQKDYPVAQPLPTTPGALAQPGPQSAPPRSTKTDSTSHPDDQEDPDDALDLFELLRGAAANAIAASPPWLISLVVHAALLVLFALLVVPAQTTQRLLLDVVLSDQIGEQLLLDDLDVRVETPDNFESPILTPVDQIAVADPLAVPSQFDVALDGTLARSDLVAPQIGLALTGREVGMKRALLTIYGGNATTEASVGAALQWLKRNQQKDGGWSLTGPYQDGSHEENRVAATALALLAFQGGGHTHQQGLHKEEVAKAWNFLLKQQNAEGTFETTILNDQLYTHAIATIALCELYGMTKDEKFRDPALKALDYAIQTQAPQGGWRYYPKQDSDTSVTGWFAMAFQSAMMAGLRAPSPTLDRINRFLDTVSNETGDRYAYLPHRAASTAMTAEALLCRQYLGWRRDDPRLKSGAAYLLENPITFRQPNVYYWYYATQVLHHLEGPEWEQWNAVMRTELPEHQVKSGPERGSWSPERDEWGAYRGGRLFTTCFCTYMLEVYYRHLPIYGFQLK